MKKLDIELRYLKGVGETRAKALAKLGLYRLGDLLRFFPRSYEDRTRFVPIREAPLEEPVCIRAMVADPPTLSTLPGGRRLVRFRAVDDSGGVLISFFNAPYVRDLLRQGEIYAFYGRMGGYADARNMINPEFEPEATLGDKTGRILPRYPLSAGLSNRMLMRYVRQALDQAGDALPDALPESVRTEQELCQARFAYENIHFPADFGALELARRRLVFEELFTLACTLGRLRAGRQGEPGIPIQGPDIAGFYEALPFSPTGAQRRAVDQALLDMASDRPMSRLVQGDVGSGKTAVAAACAWAVCKAGFQAAFMAPTEILAEQHLVTLRGFLAPQGLRVEKLTGGMKAAEKRAVKEALAAGDVDLVVGTHALLTGDVAFSRLALVITDEQHRFGVRQRGALSAKAQGETPHVLVMSATPIPRTLALMIYGDLDVSVLDELPPGRQKVDTFAVDERYRERLNGFIEKLVGQGRQVFVVCPKVEDEPDAPFGPKLKSAQEHADALQRRFPTLRVGCVHGRMRPREKEAVMSAMAAGELDILVSTTVIEVGVDVPNAALMIVESAERFGLSQLHQLRGRVGRGQHKSWCILMNAARSPEARARLEALCKTGDGFRISEEDLRLRGPGDFFGARQHGLPEMRIADLGADMRVLQSAQDAAAALLERDPELSQAEHAALRAQVESLFQGAAGTIN